MCHFPWIEAFETMLTCIVKLKLMSSTIDFEKITLKDLLVTLTVFNPAPHRDGGDGEGRHHSSRAGGTSPSAPRPAEEEAAFRGAVREPATACGWSGSTFSIFPRGPRTLEPANTQLRGHPRS